MKRAFFALCCCLLSCLESQTYRLKDGTPYLETSLEKSDDERTLYRKEVLLPNTKDQRTRELHVTYDDNLKVSKVVRAPGTKNCRTTIYEREDQKVTRKCLPDGTSILYDYDGDALVRVTSTDGTLDYRAVEGGFINSLTGERVVQKIDDTRSTTTFPNGKRVILTPDQIIIPGHAEITYKENKVIYKDQAGKLHTHTYAPNKEIMMDGLGEIKYDDKTITAPTLVHTLKLDENELPTAVVRNFKTTNLRFDHRMQLQSRQYTDPFYNIILAKTNELDEIKQLGDCSYKHDRRGFRVEKRFGDHLITYSYDALGRLLKVQTHGRSVVTYTYDIYDRKLTKRVNGELVETYIYYGIHILGIFSPDGTLKELRIPGKTSNQYEFKPVAIQTQRGLYTTLHDHFQNIARLYTKGMKKAFFYDHKPFGENLRRLCGKRSPTTAIFASHYFDRDIGLLYCNSRYYDPDTKQYLTPDPYLHASGLNPYTYCLNNPLFVKDPTGRFLIVIPLAFTLADLCVVGAVSLTAAAYLSYQAYHNLPMTLPDIKVEGTKPTDVFFGLAKYALTEGRHYYQVKTQHERQLTSEKEMHFDQAPDLEYNEEYTLVEPPQVAAEPQLVDGPITPQGFKPAPSPVNSPQPGYTPITEKFPLVFDRTKEKYYLKDLPRGGRVKHDHWKEITHPKEAAAGHRTFIDTRTGHKYRYDEAKPGETGYEAMPHYHWYNPNSTRGTHDMYLDKDGNPCRKYSAKSHLFPLEE